VDHAVDGGKRVGGRGLRPEEVTVGLERHLADVPLGDSGVALFVELDLDVVDAIEESGKAADLLLGGGTECVSEFDVPPADADVHLARSVDLRRSERRGPTPAGSGPPPRRSAAAGCTGRRVPGPRPRAAPTGTCRAGGRQRRERCQDRKSTRLNSSHRTISY